MKHYYILAFLCIGVVFGQENKTKNVLHFKPEFRFHRIFPYYLGDNFLANSNKTKSAFGLNLYIPEYNHFTLGLGFNEINHNITDVSKGGNIENSLYKSYFGLLGYNVKLNKQLKIQPYVGIGINRLKLKTDIRSFGFQSGNEFRLGSNIDCKIAEKFSAFLGAGYVISRYQINTSPEFTSFFNHSKMIQINFGVTVN